MKKVLLFICLVYHFQSSAQGVVIGGSNVDTSAILELRSTAKGLLLPRLTTVQRDSIYMPAVGLAIYNLSTSCIDYYTGTTWLSLCGYVYNKNCNQILQQNPNAPSGVYYIDPDGMDTLPAMPCYCDMTTDGGGWTLVLNYNHLANTDPSLTVRSNSLPLIGTTSLGTDESNTSYWGHASTALMNKLSFTEVRFYGVTSDHNRTMHFKTSNANTISSFKTGLGSSSGLQSNFTALSGHSSFLPGAMTHSNPNMGNLAMTNNPFFGSCNYHWSIGASSAGNPNRWEVDNMLCTGCCTTIQGITRDTYHQIWIR